MKRTLLLLIVILIMPVIHCQMIETIDRVTDRTNHSFGEFSFAASPSLLTHTPNGVQFAGGIRMRMFLSKRISFDSDIVFGRDYIHAGPGLIGIPVWIIASGRNAETELSLSDFLFVAAAMILSAEHTSYHIPVRNKTDISPYVSLLRYKSSYEYGHYSDVNRDDEQFSWALGLEINKYFKRFVISPYAELNVGYADHVPGVNTGIYLGFFFPGR
jgi:hypothetical protein